MMPILHQLKFFENLGTKIFNDTSQTYVEKGENTGTNNFRFVTYSFY